MTAGTPLSVPVLATGSAAIVVVVTALCGARASTSCAGRRPGRSCRRSAPRSARSSWPHVLDDAVPGAPRRRVDASRRARARGGHRRGGALPRGDHGGAGPLALDRLERGGLVPVVHRRPPRPRQEERVSHAGQRAVDLAVALGRSRSRARSA